MSKEKLNILYIDDEEQHFKSLVTAFSANYNFVLKNEEITNEAIHKYSIGNDKDFINIYGCQDKERALFLINDKRLRFDLIFIDFRMPNENGAVVGQQIYSNIYEAFKHEPYLIMLTGYGETAVETLRSGVFLDFIRKEDLLIAAEFTGLIVRFERYQVSELKRINAEKRAKKVEEENVQLKNEILQKDKLLQEFDNKAKISISADTRFESLDRNIVGQSPEINRVKYFIKKYAETDDNVLIIGETGTGKDLVAEAIHKLSGRYTKPFIPINCASIPEELMESELFGHIRDAFTGANKERIGRFEEANGGTVFLDEIDRMSLKSQAKILRFLEDKKVIRLGQQDNQGTVVDVRIIAAIKPKAIHTIGEKFLEDLYGRLQSLFPVLPPLNVRKDDIPLLVWHFIDLIGYNSARVYKGGENGKLSETQYPLFKYLQEYKDRKLFRFDDEGLRLMKDYKWRRNVRELRKFIENIFSVFVDKKKSWSNHLVPADDVKCAFIFHKIEIPISEDDEKILDKKYSNNKIINSTRKINMEEAKYQRALEVIKMLNSACSKVIESAGNKKIAYDRINAVVKNINENKLNQIKKCIDEGNFDKVAVIGLFCKSKNGREGMAFEGIYKYITPEFFDLYDSADNKVLSVLGDLAPLREKLDSTIQNQRVKKNKQ